MTVASERPLVQHADLLAGLPGLEDLHLISQTPGVTPVTGVRLVDLTTEAVDEQQLLVCIAADVASWRLDALIRRSALAGAAGIVLPESTPGPTLASLHIASQLRLPLLAAPPHRILDVVSTLQRLIATPEIERADRVLRCAYRWRDGTSGPENVLADVKRELGTSPVLGDQAQINEFAPDVRTDLEVEQTITRPDGTVIVSHPVPGPSRQWLLIRLDNPPDVLVDQSTTLARLAVLHLRAWFLARRWELEQDHHQQSRLLADLIAEHGAATAEIRRRAAEMGWRLDGWHIGLYFVPPVEPGEAMRDRLAAGLRGVDIPSAVVQRGYAWAGWLTSDDAPVPEFLHRLLTRLRRCRYAMGEDTPLRIGVGRAREGPTGLVASLDEAREVALGVDSRTGGVAATDAVGIHRLVGELLGSSTARDFAQSALAPLAHDTTLLDTLATYLDSGNSVTTTAARLGVHRNTVNARLNRITQTLSIDLADPDVRLAFQLACRALDVPS
ncbi:PucR family transcriptional regulator [Phytoactinopolyspora halophila]|uniref:PucR family transcriptional regulator n=1 Tax=Phytoactinopolyspora halophila TaxID=1981511 RepID=UPI001315016D|nr:helix-turn-helix domain-containing protein [Phytoactinopolyspora halophila]